MSETEHIVDIDYDEAGSCHRAWAQDRLHPRTEIVSMFVFIAFPLNLISRPRKDNEKKKNVCQTTSSFQGKTLLSCSSLLHKKVKINVKIGASL